MNSGIPCPMCNSTDVDVKTEITSNTVRGWPDELKYYTKFEECNKCGEQWVPGVFNDTNVRHLLWAMVHNINKRLKELENE